MSDTEGSCSPESFPEILETGSMLNLAAKLTDDVPGRIGPYRVLDRIGEGGMGVVYRAEQDPPLVRRVAIKLARNAVLDDRALARFENERQTLAVMNHPNIARIFDAGRAPDSRPYFVMEYVVGTSITEFCDSRRLGIESRLELFLGVCDGVQHAHLNAVIHRDLKPSNILVSTDGDRPTPKIIDFGIAKALAHGMGSTHGPTQFGQIVGTPEYMSPEQAALDGRAVDSRTDVYSMGVLLYELIVGSRPFERTTAPEESFVDLCRRIREEEPERPSVRALRPSGEIAARRLQLTRPALSRRLRGDLDAIALKALAKEPTGRYATPAEMAADIERHLQHRPIHARPPGPLIRLRKAYRRHRSAVTVIGVLSLTLIGLAILGTAQALRAHRESVRAETETRIGNEVRQFIVGVIDPPRALVSAGSGSSGSVLGSRDRDALLDRIREQFADQPLLQSQLLFAVARHLIGATGYARQITTLVESHNRIRSLLGPDSAEALAAEENLACTYMPFTEFQESERLLLDALERRRRLGADDPYTWRTTALLANLYKVWNRNDQATPLFEAAIVGLERRLGPDHPDVLSAKVGLSGSYLELHRYADTQILLEGVIDRIRHVFGDRDYHTKVALYNLACAYANLGRIELALDHLRQSIALGWTYPRGLAQDPQLFPLHGDPRFAHVDRAARLNGNERWIDYWYDAQSRVREGRFAEAERLLVDLIAAIERVDRTGAGGWVEPRLTLATCWIRQGRFSDAERFLLPTLTAVRAEKSPRDERPILELLAQCYIGRGRLDSALETISAIESSYHPMFDDVEKYYATAESQALRGLDEDALRTLAMASKLGFDDAERLEHDLAFTHLRGRHEFQTIVKSVRQRAL